MQWPTITAGYLGVLALTYAVLAVNVIRLRASGGSAFGDGGDEKLRNAIRAHANFAEYVPIIALMVAMLEVAGASAIRVHVLMAGLLLSRLMHPLGMSAKPKTLRFRLFRTGGMWLTLIVLVASAVTILSRLARGY
ncbi:MAG TPA: MAPEG family protein [Bradyrhizobium sp.]|uniref:MAPEG family protein n=1 Tax=Bradyrhizobium sp. TaxID=376 RepID=UPI002CBFD9C4|nr:MAPEG family protein [Bradyrhizobium sp.]HLZ04828.1 MAPEG family protein [Bradyrhizobium sp.]